MPKPPEFTSDAHYVKHRGDARFWRPYVTAALEQHGLGAVASAPVAGARGTYPTFLVGDLVVKLFGHIPSWREGYARERAALALLTAHSEIPAPRLLASGRLFAAHTTEWPYVVSTRVPGIAWAFADLTREQRQAVVADLGRQIRRVHALPTSDAPTDEALGTVDVVAAAERSSLPRHLIAQIDDYLARLGEPDLVFTHGDLTTRHVYVENGRLVAIIDWGDAIVMDRHYEIIQPYRDICACDKALFRVFMDAYGWPEREDFPLRALGMALYRQAHGLVQHLAMDVFEPIAALLPLDGVATLDDLAMELFHV